MCKYIKEIAIIGLVILETAAILTHTDGAYFMPVVAAISGLGGYELAKGKYNQKSTKAGPK